MAEDEKEGEGTSRGTDWEVVSLTASTYAAAPGPKGFGPPEQSKDTNLDRNEQASSDAMFLSGHFVFPSNDHVDLPIESDYSEIHTEPGGQDVNPSEDAGDGTNKTNEDTWKVKSDDGLHGIQFFDKGKSLSVHDVEFGEGKALQGLTMVGEEQVMYGSPGFGAFHAETDISQSVLCHDSTDIPEPNNPSGQNLDSPVDLTNASKPNDENEHGGSDLPCEAWWKRQAITLYSHVKEANAFWPVFVAAAVMGLVIFGQRWRREKVQLQQVRWQSNITNERMNQMVGPISLFKGVLVGRHQRSPQIHGGATSSHFGV